MYTLNQQKTLFYRYAKRNISFSAYHACVVQFIALLSNNFLGIYTLFVIQFYRSELKVSFQEKNIVQNIINTKLEVPGGYITTCFRAQYTSHTWCRQYKSKKQLSNYFLLKPVFQIRYRR